MEEKISNKINILSKKILKIIEEIKEVRIELQMSRIDGDLSENADWNILNEKLLKLEEEKYNLEEVKIKLIENDNNMIENFITYKDLRNEKIRKILLTNFSYSVEHSEGIISLNSPLGKSLFNKKEKEICRVFISKSNYYDIMIIKIEEK